VREAAVGNWHLAVSAEQSAFSNQQSAISNQQSAFSPAVGVVSENDIFRSGDCVEAIEKMVLLTIHYAGDGGVVGANPEWLNAEG
jgi:hypothetical protein